MKKINKTILKIKIWKWVRQKGLYGLKWQLGTFTITPCVMLLPFSPTINVIIGNIIGAILVYPIDQWIFTGKGSRSETVRNALWESKQNVKCADCGVELDMGFRLTKTENYDKTQDNDPQFRCGKCSKNKLDELKKRGIKF